MGWERVLPTIILKSVVARSRPEHTSVVELADDTWPFRHPNPASTLDGEVTVRQMAGLGSLGTSAVLRRRWR